MRERHLPVPRATAWTALLGQLGADADDLSVEAPWRHVRHLAVEGIDRVEQTLILRDDGDECHLAWCVGLTAELDDPAADATLVRLGEVGEGLLDAIAEAAA